MSGKSANSALLALCVAMLCAAVLLIVVQFLSLRQSFIEDMQVQGRIVSSNITAAIVFRDVKTATETLAALNASSSIAAAAIFIEPGPAFAYYSRGKGNALQAPTPALMLNGHEFHWNYLDLVQTAELDGKPIAQVVMRASLDALYGRFSMYALITLCVIFASLGIGYLMVARMRQAVAQAEEHLTYLAHIDAVTGLPNRHAFNERLAHSLVTVARFGGQLELLLLDLDNFKAVNDSLGHNQGDQLLKAVGDRLSNSLRDADIVCRIGGDEFAMILQSRAGSRTGEAVAQKVILSLAAPFEIAEQEVFVTGSIGVSSSGDDRLSPLTLTRNADAAMYAAKAKGKNTYEIFRQEMNQHAKKRLALETSLRKAIQNNELSLCYQPKLLLRHNRIVGFEALLRWTNPQLGSVSPVEFIPIAEETGLINEIGMWVTRTVCMQVAVWEELGLRDFKVSINLSPRQTKNANLAEEIFAEIAAAGIDASRLELEITESQLMENVGTNIELLSQLRARGLRLSIDDFGTGYSSMAYLKRFPINELKIDRSFVRDIPGDGEDEAIITAIIALGHGLGLSVIAEGVETEQQMNFLRSVQCDSIQGYFLAKPMPAADVPGFLRKTHSQGKHA
ncbi:EAL domain-containing protein [Undibacterium sp. TS12]|uniref:putative bifunctional diguanylate cyclase/phosphodiesterase n=1 Tax=Undibacterium sp. TS12 TaxID=2908202 RepID=UPI001F4CEA4D|nr:EAL domain-containing protein [Undibacterium sp. TS12]MCH8617520.1 EAL domain-containing protein [Undibacterium sp. TS12]